VPGFSGGCPACPSFAQTARQGKARDAHRPDPPACIANPTQLELRLFAWNRRHRRTFAHPEAASSAAVFVILGVA